MKILIFNHVYTPYQKGGAEVSTQLLAESLSALGNEVHVCTTAPEDKDENINSVIVHRFKEHNLYWSYENEKASAAQKMIWHTIELYNVFNKKSIEKILDMVKPDIVHTNVISGFSTIVWKLAKDRGIPVVHTMRDYYLMCIKATRFNGIDVCNRSCAICKYYSIPKRHFSQNVDAVVGISKYILDLHLQNGYFKNVKVNGVIYNAIKSVSISDNYSRRPVIGYLGRVHPSKGIELLIEAFLRVNSDKYTLEVGGTGDISYIESLKQKYNCDKVKFLGKVDAYKFLHSIELLVVPSLWHEPFGRVIVEANACGCPVFVSNRGGMPELVNGNNGSTFNIADRDDLKNKIDSYISGKSKFSLEGFDMSIYSSEHIAKQYLDIYKSLVY